MISRQNVYENYPFVVVGVIVEKDGKILLVQEAETERGSWNQPAGWLEKYENPVEAAKREGEEETGLALEVTDFLGVYSFVKDKKTTDSGIDRHPIKLIFVAKPTGESAKTLPGEIMSSKWFMPDEIYAMNRETLRDDDIKDEVRDYFSGKRYSLDIIHHFKPL